MTDDDKLGHEGPALDQFPLPISVEVSRVTQKWGAPVAPRYEVSLPHQCDRWEICYASTKERALEQLDDFLARILDAKQRLRELE